MYKLIVCEKPSVAMEFAKILGATNRQDGYMEGNSWLITWAVGHLVTMDYPDEYDEKYKKWNLEDLPFIPDKYRYHVIDDVKKQFKIVKALLNRSDVDLIYNAGDSAREGEYIQRLIYQEAGVNQKAIMMRIWTDSQTEEAIQEAIQNAKPATEYDKLAAAAYERAIEDYLSGMNFSRAYSVRFNNLIKNAAELGFEDKTTLSVGRVMTCVLGMVVEKEEQVRKYVPSFSYGVQASLNDNNKIVADWKAVSSSDWFESPKLAKDDAFVEKNDAENLMRSFEGKQLCVASIDKDKEFKKAPLLFNLAELQAECTKRFKFSPSETLNYVQKLYESKLTTYPRTGARVLSTAVAKEITKNIRGLKNVPSMNKFAETILSQNYTYNFENSKYVDDSKISDHYAIIPTGNTDKLNELRENEKQVFLLICERFLSIFYPAAEIGKIGVEFSIGNEKLYTTISNVKTKGYYEVIGYEEKEDKHEIYAFLDQLQPGQKFNATYAISEKKTQAPKRYTSGSMVLAMENAGKLIEDPELRAQIKTSGIGTDATRAEVIKKLIQKQYISVDKKTQILTPTMIGEMICCVIRDITPLLLNPEFTANWEKGLAQIEEGVIAAETYRSKLNSYIISETDRIKIFDNVDALKEKLNLIRTYYGKTAIQINESQNKLSAETNLACPCCGKPILTSSWGFKCADYQDKKCNFTVGEICGTKISLEQLEKILNIGKSDVMTFKGKNNKNFDAVLTLQTEENGNKRIWLDFNETPKKEPKSTGLNCPCCNKELKTISWGYACEDYKNGCMFSVGEICGTKIPEKELKKILAGEESSKMKFTKKAGGTFEGVLTLQDDAEKGKKIWLKPWN